MSIVHCVHMDHKVRIIGMLDEARVVARALVFMYNRA
jgi:hypothetical protein